MRNLRVYIVMNQKTIWFWIKTLLIALVIAWFLRTFVIESYRVPASSMENTLLEGDRIFVSKLSYGIRLPMTPLSLPFFHDSIRSLGIKSYSTLVKIPYIRLFKRDVTRNDVVIFNQQGENFNIPIDKQKISISRCLALPGDSLAFENDLVRVNGNLLTQSPNLLEPYFYHQKDNEIIGKASDVLQIPTREAAVVDTLHVRLLSRIEAAMLQQNLPKDVQLNAIRPNYKLVIPKKGDVIRITDDNYYFYWPIITGSERCDARFENDSLWINGGYTEDFKFTQDYYWMLPDNRVNYADDATSAFVSETHIIGKAIYLWNRGIRKIR